DPWEDWIAAGKPQPAKRLLMRPPSKTARQSMLQVNLLTSRASSPGKHVIRLRDITNAVASQQAVWSFQGLVRHKLSTALSKVLGSLQLLETLNVLPQDATTREFFTMALRGATDMREQLQHIFRYMDAPNRIESVQNVCAIDEVLTLITAICQPLSLASLH